MNRREALKFFGGGVGVLGAGKAVDNVLVGYGPLVGTNLREQDLQAVAGEHLPADRWYRESIDGFELLRQNEVLFLLEDGEVVETASLERSNPERPREIDAAYDLTGDPFETLYSDVPDLQAGRYRFEFHEFDPFFDRLADATTRPFTVGLLRSNQRADPAVVERFSGAAPSDPRAVLRGLVESFREHSYYDVPRYVAGSLTDNVFMGAVKLRKYFRSPVDFTSLLNADGTGMFCYEFTNRSIEAIHARPAYDQTAPVVGVRVRDYRHKHVYTGVASVIRDDGDLTIPMTFVDYTHTTLYDDFGLTPVLGDGFDAYNDRHRADEMFW